MTRDMEKTAEKAIQNIPDKYTIMSDEIMDLMKKARLKSPDETFDAILTAFRYGFVLGHRATIAGKVNKRL